MSEAKEYLERIGKLDDLIINKQWELAQMRAVAEGMAAQGQDITIKGEKQAMDKVQSAGNPHRMENAICSMVDVEKRVAQDIACWQAEKQEIISTIQPLPKTEYNLLHDVYVKGRTLSDVADQAGKSRSWADTLHGIALKRVQVELDRRKATE